jgi:hypothetical protein
MAATRAALVWLVDNALALRVTATLDGVPLVTSPVLYLSESLDVPAAERDTDA